MSPLIVLLTAAVLAAEPSQPKAWDDADDVAAKLATGSVEICEVLATPLGFVPSVGTVLEMGAEWACLIPGSLSADYVHRQHGRSNGQIWQGVLGLAVGKAWRDLTRIAVAGTLGVGAISVLGVMVVASGLLSLTVWPVAPLFIPLMVAAAVAGAAVTYTMLREIRKSVQELLFKTIYGRITGGFEDDASQARSQRTALIRPRLNIVERAWLLAAVASGAEAESTPLHWIPVVGPVIKARHKAEAMQTFLRRVSSEDLKETHTSWGLVDGTVNVLLGLEGVLGSFTHVTLMGAVGLLAVGAVLAVIQIPLGLTQMREIRFSQPHTVLPDRDAYLQAVVRSGPLALLTGGLGVAALALTASAVVFIAGREIPKALVPIAVPLAYGILPPGEWFPSRNDPNAPDAEQPIALPPPDVAAPADTTDPVDAWMNQKPAEAPVTTEPAAPPPAPETGTPVEAAPEAPPAEIPATPPVE